MRLVVIDPVVEVLPTAADSGRSLQCITGVTRRVSSRTNCGKTKRELECSIYFSDKNDFSLCRSKQKKKTFPDDSVKKS